MYRPSRRRSGNPHQLGTFVGEWGCTFENIQPGVIGEVKQPMIDDIEDWRRVEPPYETLPEDWTAARDEVNRQCGAIDKFIRAACCPRPWERLQFLRGTVPAMMDTTDPDGTVRDLIKRIHEFYLKELEFWVTTDVDARFRSWMTGAVSRAC